MAMNVTEANAVNRLLDQLVAEEPELATITVTIGHLLAGAYKRLGAGRAPTQAAAVAERIVGRIAAADSDDDADDGTVEVQA